MFKPTVFSKGVLIILTPNICYANAWDSMADLRLRETRITFTVNFYFMSTQSASI